MYSKDSERVSYVSACKCRPVKNLMIVLIKINGFVQADPANPLWRSYWRVCRMTYSLQSIRSAYGQYLLQKLYGAATRLLCSRFSRETREAYSEIDMLLTRLYM